MKTKLVLIILALCWLPLVLEAQEIPGNDSIPSPNLDTLGLQVMVDSSGITFDTAFQQKDSILVFTSSVPLVEYSKDSLEEEVESYGNDSMRYDIANKLIHLWGDAYVIYGDITLKADYIVYNWTDNIVTAEYSLDSLGQKKGQPQFTDKDQTFTANKMRYNFKTQKGVVMDAVSTYNGMYVLGGKAKIFGEGADSIETHQHIYSEDAIFTTCNHPYPHFGIRSRKQKVVPDKVVVVGPSNLEVGGVPTPIWLPFGFFPLKTGDRTGLIFPRNYEYSDNLGFGLNGVGWYFPINEYLNLTVTGKIYSRGTWGLSTNSQYKKIYKYSGSLSLNYSDQKVERGIDIVSDKAFAIAWTHNQDPKAHPYNTFRGGVNIQTNNYQSRNENDAATVQQNTLRSNLNFTKIFPDNPFTLTASLSHSQVTSTGKVDVELPTIGLRMKTIYPFRNKNRGGNKEKWYEKFGVKYDADAQNKFSATDTTLFTRQTLEDARFGVRHKASTNASFRVLKYFNLSPSVNYTEVWHFKTLDRVFDPTPVVDSIFADDGEGELIRLDTTAFGTVEDRTDFGFKPLRLFNTSLNLGTTLYGTILPKKGWLRGFRHTAKPSISLNYNPDYTGDNWNYFKTVRTSTETDEEKSYSIFTGGVYNESIQSKQMSLGYRITNNFEGKYYSKRDSMERKFKLFETVNVTGNYNFAADSLKFSRIMTNGSTKLIPNNISTLNLAATFDPYIEEDGDRVNKLVWNENKKLFRFVSATARVNTGFSIKQMVDIASGKKGGKRSAKKSNKGKGPKGLGNESLLSLVENFRVNHQFNMSYTRIGEGANQRDTFQITTNSLTLQGKLQLTDKWALSIGQLSYNFKIKRLVYPSLTFYRDLHCWEMGMSWYPERNTFSFFLHVKPGALDFIKVPYGRNNIDGRF